MMMMHAMMLAPVIDDDDACYDASSRHR